jgi:hypothetical protein
MTGDRPVPSPNSRRNAKLPVSNDVLRFAAPIAYVVLIFIGIAISATAAVVCIIGGAILMGLLYTLANPGSPFDRRRN